MSTDPKPGFRKTPQRWISKKCPTCEKVTSGLQYTVACPSEIPKPYELEFGQERTPGGPFLSERGPLSGPVLECRGCGRKVPAKPVAGVLKRDVACNAKCMASKGHDCECSCGGKNHGASYDSNR